MDPEEAAGEVATAGAATACMVTLSWAATSHVQWAPITSSLMMAVGYFGQDLAHWMTGQATFQSTYIQKGLEEVIRDMAEHTFYLLPLVLDACLHLDHLPLFSWVVAYNKVLRTKLDGPDMKTHMATIVRYDPSVPSLPCSQPIQNYHAKRSINHPISSDHLQLGQGSEALQGSHHTLVAAGG